MLVEGAGGGGACLGLLKDDAEGYKPLGAPLLHLVAHRVVVEHLNTNRRHTNRRQVRENIPYAEPIGDTAVRIFHTQ